MDVQPVRPDAAAVAPDEPTYPTSACPGPRCGRQVIWAIDDKTLTRIPVDPDPAPDGDVKLLRQLDSHMRERLTAHVCTKKELATTSWGLALRCRHNRTCPDGTRTPTKRSRS